MKRLQFNLKQLITLLFILYLIVGSAIFIMVFGPERLKRIT